MFDCINVPFPSLLVLSLHTLPLYSIILAEHAAENRMFITKQIMCFPHNSELATHVPPSTIMLSMLVVITS